MLKALSFAGHCRSALLNGSNSIISKPPGLLACDTVNFSGNHIKNQLEADISQKINQYFSKDFSQYLNSNIVPELSNQKLLKPNINNSFGYQQKVSENFYLINFNKFLDNENFRQNLENNFSKKNKKDFASVLAGAVYKMYSALALDRFSASLENKKLTADQEKDIITKAANRYF